MKQPEQIFRLGDLRKDRQGTAAAEFAMILPLLIIFLAVVMDFGRLMLDYHAASKSVRDASRYLSLVDVACDATGGTVVNAGNITIAKNLALTGSVDAPGAGDYLLSYWTDPASIDVSVTCIANGLSGRYAGMAFIPTLTVTATVPFSLFFGKIVYSGTELSFVTSTNMVWLPS